MRESLIPRGPDDTLASSEPSPEKEQRPEKLTFEESSGSFRYDRIPYEIRYNLNAATIRDAEGTFLDETFPANWLLMPDEHPRPDSYVEMWVHETCPPQYKHIVMYHELVEAELVLCDNIDHKKAHNIAVDATDAYAEAHLSPKGYEEYKEWERKTLGDDIIDGRSKPRDSNP